MLKFLLKNMLIPSVNTPKTLKPIDKVSTTVLSTRIPTCSFSSSSDVSYLQERHRFHIVANSPWPFCLSSAIFSILTLSVHKMTSGAIISAECFLPLVFLFLFVMYQ